ncbi:MAG: CDP-alcohol phosphatidyltransferase family protein [Thermoanaerobaculia bacterium]
MTLSLPNLLSLLRMGLIPLFVIEVLRGEPFKALLVFAVAGLSDALDGFLARVLDQRSLLGAYLDPIADKLLLMTAFIVLTVQGTSTAGVQIPVWVTVLVIARDVLVVVVALALALAVGRRDFPPSALSKVNTVFQVVGVLLVLLSGLDRRFNVLALGALYGAATLTVLSGIGYILRANRMVAEVGE